MKQGHRSYTYALLAIFFWATVPTAFKLSLKELPVLPMLTVASVASALILLVITTVSGKTALLFRASAREFFFSAALGLINPFIYYLILLKAYQLLPAQVAQPLNMIWPIILVFLSVPILHQKIRPRSYLALFISFAGVYIISSQGSLLKPGRSDLQGVLLATGSSIFWTLYFILNVKDKRDEAVKLTLNFLFGSAYLLLAMFFTGAWENTDFTRPGLAASVYVGLFEMGLTFWLWLKALKLAETTDKVSNLVYLAPFLSLVFVHFILREPVYLTTPAGLVLIIAGILIQNRKQATV